MSERLQPRVCVLKTDGTNCDVETAFSFNQAGGTSEIVMINELKEGEKKLADYQVLAFPGGFSYGDDLGSGTVLATELEKFLFDQLNEFRQRSNALIFGACNGMQVLTRSGLLPYGDLGNPSITLDANVSGKFRCDSVKLKIDDKNTCKFMGGLGGVIEIPVAHGEGNLTTSDENLKRIEEEGLVVFRYADPITGEPTQEYPHNPNGSMNAIAGLTDSTGRTLGLMPHLERAVKRTQYINWRRMPSDFVPEGRQFFDHMIDYVREGV